MQSWMVGIVLGILPIGWLPDLPAWYVPFGLIAVGVVTHLRYRAVARFFIGLALGSVLAIHHGQQLLGRQLPEDCVLMPLAVSGVVSALPRLTIMPDGSSRQRFEFLPDTITPLVCSAPSRLLLSYYGEHKIIPGERWRLQVKLKKPWGLANPGSFNMQGWFAQTGIDAVGSVKSGSAQRLPGLPTLQAAHHRVRLDITEHIEALDLPLDVKAVLRAITVADKSGMDYRLWAVLQQFGVNHLLVISGLHISMVAGLGLLLGGAVQRLLLMWGMTLLWLPGGMALLLATVYAAVAGFSLPTLRALGMLCCFVVAGWSGRASTPFNTLLLAAVVVLVMNPLAGVGSGFWLSFGAVAALLWLARWQAGHGRARSMAGTHAYMSLVMLPIASWWFGGASLVAAPANFLLIPLVGFIVVPLALVAALAHLSGWGVEQFLWQAAAWPLLQFVPMVADLDSGTQGWLYRHFSGGLPAFLLALLGVLGLVTPVARPLKLVALLLLLPLLVPERNLDEVPEAATRVTVLDVGQGTAILVRSGRQALLYDTGGGDPAGANMASAVVLPYLRQQGIQQLDTLVVSHPDRDHSAGAGTVLSALPVEHFFYGQPLPGLPGGQPCVAGQAWQWPGGQVFRFLSPAGEADLASNEASCVLQLEAGGARLLIPGDISSEREKQLVRYWREELRSDWLLLAHHGSRSSTSPAFLKQVRPAAVIVNSGYANRFGHPHPDVMGRLDRGSVSVWATAEGGALQFDFMNGQPPLVSAYRDRLRHYWK